MCEVWIQSDPTLLVTSPNSALYHRDDVTVAALRRARPEKKGDKYVAS